MNHDDGDRVLRAAEAVFFQFGVQRANVQDVADRAGVSRSTLYRRFASKDELFAAIVDRQVADFLSGLYMATIAMTHRQVYVECIARAARLERHLPLLARIAAIEPERLTCSPTQADPSAIQGLRAGLERLLRGHAAVPDDDQIAAIVALAVRLGVGSLVCGSASLPAGDDPDVAWLDGLLAAGCIELG
ncbi:MAG: TetR/AcrR family transcriptional regulator [Marmoricola sp.]